MGASLDTPAKCPLCKELTRDLVALKCNHRFCRRCIGDLWSVSPNGPYRCPQWRCQTEYRTLPFDSGLIRQPRCSAATSSKDDQNGSESALRRPPLTSQILGKRKASTPASDQPDTKRSTLQSPFERPSGAETPTTSSSNKPGQSAGVETVDLESAQSECGDATSSSDNKAVPASDEPQDTLVQQSQHEPESVTLDDSDSSNEVDICDVPAPTTPGKDVQFTGVHTSPKKSATPASSNSFTGVSAAGDEKSPAHHVKSPLIFSKNAATASGSSSFIDTFSSQKIRSTRSVPCHYCPKAGYQFAVKTCLVCGASMCTEHLRPHLDSPVFQNHTLVPPMEDISSWRCQEHQEMNKIFCRQCRVCVCTVCTVIGSHRDHVCISIREAERELRGDLKENIKQLQSAEQQVKNKVAEFMRMKETSEVVLTEARKGVQLQYKVIREALKQEEQSALQCVMKEESRVLGGLEEKLSSLQSFLLSIQQGLHTLEELADAKGDERIQEQVFIMEYSKVGQMAVNRRSFVEQFETPEELDQDRLKCLQKWTEKRLDTVIITVPGNDRDLHRLLYGTVPFLDPDTAHSKLHLSENNRRVTYSDTPQLYTEHEARFSSFPQVLASRALEGSRWYWEVNVSVDDGRWKVGLSDGQIERKGQKDSSRLGFNSYSWCLACDKRKVEALHNKVSVPVDSDQLQRLGVFLDFEEGVLSFSKVTPEGSLTLMHSYHHRFTGPLYPALSVSKTRLTICDLFQS
ncbi:tripartite motif-containing protein 14 [Echeneis naucrates]|uniref:Tripartite motif-containing protein 14-like n=1 Tax=Echeneis naucrates TaxID=173247 RepID=A0A665UHW5_ECHNA|nr:tripartite motif-containing protein 14-like [Echeneis naucrates]